MVFARADPHETIGIPHTPHISLIVAVSRNGIIGRDNALPWHLPADLKYFKATTANHAVIMGRRTFESLGGKPLPGRTNIVITRDRTAMFPGALVAHDFDQAFAIANQHDLALHHKNEVFVLGGAEIFRKALNHASRIYRTLIEADIHGDTQFPNFDESQWQLVRDEPHAADGRHAYAYRFQVFERRAPRD